FYLKIEVLDSLNGLVTKLAASGLFEVISIHFGVEHERAALNEARRRAMADARDQAAVYADAADVQLLAIAAITDGEAVRALGAGAVSQAPRFVQVLPPATVAFTSSVQVTWRIGPR